MALGGFSRTRRWLGTAEGLGAAAVVVVLVAVVTYAATRPTLRHRLDLTEGDQFTLSDQTRQVLSSLEQPVSVVMLMRPEVGGLPNGLFEVQTRAIQYVDSLLHEYEIASGGKLSARRLRPDSDRLEAEGVARDLNLTRYNVLVVSGGDRYHVVRLEDMVTIDPGLAQPDRIQPAQLIDVRGEAPLTGAVLDVAQANPPRVGFLRGFGGPSTDDEGGFGLFMFREQVRGQGCRPEEVDLSGADGVPEGLAALVVWGPELPIGARVRDALIAYHERGGALLIAVEPLHEDPDLDALLARIGVVRERRILCRDDVRWEGLRRSGLVLDKFAADHEITAPIVRQGSFATVFGAGGLGRAPEAPAGSAVDPIVTAPVDAFGDQPSAPGQPGDWTLGQGEVRGARYVAYAISGKGGRAVVFGASTLLTTDFLLSSESGSANLDLGLNSIHWLVRREQAIGARPRQIFESHVDLTPDEHERVVLYVLVLMPLGAVVLGVLVWMARRR